MKQEAGVGPQSAHMCELYSVAARVAPRNVPVMVTGETGVGKEVLVRRIHQLAGRKGPLSVVNCAALPPELAESILFGYERGSFTGAERTTVGAVETADGGTLFLDEIGELNTRTQAALLRVLQDKRVTRVGSTVHRAVDIRIIAATHRDLDALARDGIFRSDLLYRLNAVTLHIPPLRERREEIEGLARYFVSELASEWGIEAAAITPRALDMLRGYAWPGNVRQLRNVIQHTSALLHPGSVIDSSDLPGFIREDAQKWSCSPVEAPAPSVAAAHDSNATCFRQSVRQYEVALIVDGLRRSDGNVAVAANLLRLPVRTLSYKISRHKIRA